LSTSESELPQNARHLTQQQQQAACNEKTSMATTAAPHPVETSQGVMWVALLNNVAATATAATWQHLFMQAADL